MTRVKIIFFSLFLSVKVFSQPLFFEKKYGGFEPDYSRSMFQDSNGEIYLLGFSNTLLDQGQIMLTKTDVNGIALWTKFYGDDLNDIGISITETFDNNLLIAYEKHTNSDGIDIGLLKVDKNGEVLWQNSISSPVNESPKSITKTLDSCYAVVGFINDAFGLTDIYLVKTDSLGNKLWDVTLGGDSIDSGCSIIQLSDSALYVLGDTESGTAGSVDVYLAKLDKNGNLLWQQKYGNQYANGSQGFILTSDNQIFIYGETSTATSFKFDYYTLLVDTSGNQIWQYDIGGLGSDAAFSAIEDIDGNFILAGYSNSYDTLNPIKVAVFKINHQGELVWEYLYGGNGINLGYVIMHSQGGGLLVTGHTYDNVFSFQQYLLHLTAEGTLYINESNKFADIKVYPNPFENLIYISESSEIKNINLYNYFGQSVSFTRNNNQLLFDKNIPSGIYFLQMENTSGVLTTAKIVKN